MGVEKIYARILEKKEAEMGRDALREKRAANLTKHFLKLSEAEEKRKLEAQAEKSKREDELSLQRMKETSEQETLMRHVVKEEKNAIYARMQEMTKRRELEKD